MAEACVSANDVAAFILERRGPISAMKLQKLLYYSHAWSLVWDEKPLFSERIEAWVNGPVLPEIYAQHRGEFLISSWKGNANALSQEQQDTVNGVLQFYADKSAQWLSDLTHAERPWLEARKGLPEGVRSGRQISDSAMAEYYSSL
jgi:uncharacterized phage-associated protein